MAAAVGVIDDRGLPTGGSAAEGRRCVIDNVALVHIHDRKLLVARSRGKDRWYLPGGKREPGESDEETLTREIREELSVEIQPGTLRHVGTYEGEAHGQPSGSVVRMACYTALWSGQLGPGREIEQLGVLGFDDRARAAPLVQHILQDLRTRQLI